MSRHKPSLFRIPDSLPLRVGAFFILLLVAAAFAVGYLFDRGRTEALQERELQQLRLRAERAADEVERYLRRVRGDVLFLAGTPPIQGIFRALEGGGQDPVGGSTLLQWTERLEQILLAFAEARPEYFQLRLIGARQEGREIVRVERTASGLGVTPPDELQEKGGRYYFREAVTLPAGEVYLSRIDLNREHGRISTPHQPTLRAVTTVRSPGGTLLGVVVLNLDMGRVFERTKFFLGEDERIFIADKEGHFLFHPEPRRAFGFEFETPFRLPDVFPVFAEQPPGALGSGAFFEVLDDAGKSVAYATSRSCDPAHPDRHLMFVLAAPAEHVYQTVGLMRRESLIGTGVLLSLVIALVVVMVRGLTRSLSTLAKAAEAISLGEYRVALPEVSGGEVGTLAAAFQRMVDEVEAREETLTELNRDLENRVAQRTEELARQHVLQRLILENVADGVIVSDREGRFLLWNRKAEQIVGAPPADVPPGRWAAHFGVFSDESGDPLPTEELPLVRAMNGESIDSAELYLRNPKRKEGRWVQVTARPLRDADGAIAGGVAALLDVTEQKRLRRRVEEHRGELAKVGRMVLSAEIVSSAAHQLSQPIAAICNYAGAAVRLQERGRLDGAELSNILESIERLGRTSGEILDKLRTLIRRRNHRPCPVDVNQVVESSLDLLKERIERRCVALERRFADVPAMIYGDPIELEHVLIQLIVNALEAMDQTPRGERRLSVRTNSDLAAGLVVIEVEDTGPGVRGEIAESLFDLWATDKLKNLGLGLAIVQSIVETLHGQIRWTGGEAGGALFRVELPAMLETNP